MTAAFNQVGRTMGAGPRILVIEDDALQIQAHVMMLEDWGYHPVVARDAGEALLQLADGPPDLLICDYLLAGGVTGPRVVEELRAACGRTVPALFVTGIGDAQPLAEIAAIGGVLVARPFNLRKLRRTIATVLGT
jgi:two-component system phosphate regulon response regulator PhoB